MSLFAQNSKIKASGNTSTLVYNFGIPASSETCPLAGECAKGCYAKQGAYAWPVVSAAYTRRLELVKGEDWSELQAELDKLKRKAAREAKQLVIRWHDSGDYFSLDYLVKALAFFEQNSDVVFYSYTKMVPLFKRFAQRLPKNFTVIFSEGGKADRMIDRETDRHARVFESLDELKAAGYKDTTENDLNAISDSLKIGLVYHGAKGKRFTTKEGV